MVSAQTGLIYQVTRDLTHTRFCVATLFVHHYSDYCYTHVMRGTSDEETLRAKEAYKRLAVTHGARV